MRQCWQAEQAELMQGAAADLRSRAQEEMGLWLAGLRPWTLWATLTVDPKRSPPLSWWSVSSQEQYRREAAEGRGRRVARDVMVRMVRASFAAAEDLLGHRVDYVACLEVHRSGALHAHAMVDTGELGQGCRDVEVLEEGWYSRYGFCRFEPPRDVLNAAQYAGKHLVKREGAELILSRGLGWRELPRRPRFL